MPLRNLIVANRPGILTYGITPPKQSYPTDKRFDLAMRQSARIRGLPIDALVVYDIQDESARTSEARPFPYLSCIDPTEYALVDLADVEVPKVVYRCVGSLTLPAFTTSLDRIDAASGLSVLVGPASRNQPATLKLSEAHALANARHPTLPIGGVAIAERHEQTLSEHERITRKMDAGCRFFISQAVYSVAATKNLLSDLYYCCEAQQRCMPPILITLSPCGSLRTLEFMRWLGVSVPRWLENDLHNSRDILQTSIKVCLDVLADLQDFASSRKIPLGCNVESVSLMKVEIEASVELVHLAAVALGRPRDERRSQ